MSKLIQRRDATQATLDRFNGRNFDWDSEANATCVHMLHYHVQQMGHDVPNVPSFRSAAGALRELKKHGWSNLTEMLDDLFERKPVSRMLMGDIALAPAEGPIEAIFICAGPFKMFGWHEDRPELVRVDVDLNILIGAWEFQGG